MIKPKGLEKGDCIGIVSTSSPVAYSCPRRLKRGINELELMGFKVKIGKSVGKKNGHLAGSVNDRLNDIHNMVSDPEVNAIMNTIGGFNSNQLIEELDYGLIKANPKIFIGYSDFTAVLLSIHKKADLVTFMGPAVLPQFGEYGGVFPYTYLQFEKVLMKREEICEIPPSDFWSSEFLSWDEEDIRPRKLVPNPGPSTIKAGIMEGQALSGNMGTMLLLAGTSFFPNVNGKILFLEDDDEESPGTIDRYLHHFRHLGVFDKIKGLVIGRFHPKVNLSESKSLAPIVLQATEGYNFPIVINADFGHTDPMMTIPNGIRVKVKASYNDIKITLKETSIIK